MVSDNFIIRSLQAQVKDLEGRLLLKSEKVLKLQEEVEMLRADNAILQGLNEQFAKENIRLRLRRGELLQRRYERLNKE